jgi:hypothetical protein
LMRSKAGLSAERFNYSVSDLRWMTGSVFTFYFRFHNVLPTFTMSVFLWWFLMGTAVFYYNCGPKHFCRNESSLITYESMKKIGLMLWNFTVWTAFPEYIPSVTWGLSVLVTGYASCCSRQYPKRLPDTASDNFLKHVQHHIIVTPKAKGKTILVTGREDRGSHIFSRQSAHKWW